MDSTDKWRKQSAAIVLGASSYTYAEATWTQGLEDWIAAHVRTFEFLGGVPEIVVPDNTRAAVNKSCRYEPDLNRTYQDLAAHYGVAVVPACPAKPRDKAKVERHYYSVPYQVTRETVELRATAATLEIFHQGTRIASHARSGLLYQATTVAAHRPKSHQRHLEWPTQRPKPH